jgi:hypothetical protein
LKNKLQVSSLGAHYQPQYPGLFIGNGVEGIRVFFIEKQAASHHNTPAYQPATAWKVSEFV